MAEMMLTLSLGTHSVSTDIEVPETIGNSGDFVEFRKKSQARFDQAMNALEDLSGLVLDQENIDTKEF